MHALFVQSSTPPTILSHLVPPLKKRSYVAMVLFRDTETYVKFDESAFSAFDLLSLRRLARGTLLMVSEYHKHDPRSFYKVKTFFTKIE